MNEHGPFEQRLRRQPLRQMPSAWREEILAGAKAAAEANRPNAASACEDRAALLAGWRLLFARMPLAWASLAALWIALVGVNLMLPSPMVRMAEPSSPSAQMELLAALDFQPGEFEPSSDRPAPASQAVPATERPALPVRPRSERPREMRFADQPHAGSLAQKLPGGSADLHSILSPARYPFSGVRLQTAKTDLRPAECNSALGQIADLHYGCEAHGPTPTAAAATAAHRLIGRHPETGSASVV